MLYVRILSNVVCLERMTDKLKILFLCTGNSCRSQMAEGWARELKNDTIQAFSAGLDAHGLNINAVRVMQEAGVDITSQHSKKVEKVETIPFDFVITLCGHADENCPFIVGAEQRIPVRYEDPKAFDNTPQKLEKYRERSLQIATELFYVFSQINS